MNFDKLNYHNQQAQMPEGDARNLPKGWEIKKFGDVLVKTEKVDPTKNPEVEFTYLDVSSVNKETKEIKAASILFGKDAPSRARKLIKANDVIFATVRPTHSRVALITEEYDEQVCSTGYFVLRGKENIDNKYLFYFLLTVEFNTQMEMLQKGASYPAVTDSEVKSVLLRYPTSLPEQQRIVSILDEAFAAIDKAKANAEQNLKNAKELFESYLQGVFEKKGDGWVETTLKNEIDLLTGFAFKSKYYTASDKDILLVRGDNIMQGYFRWEDAKRWSITEFDDYKKFQLCENDVVLAMDRPWVKAGLKCAMISKEEIPSLLVQRTASLRCRRNLNNSFLFYLVKSKSFTSHLLGVQTGIGVPHISGKQILQYPFYKPPIDEQQTIVHQLDALHAETQKMEAIYQKKIADLEELKKSVLQKAFAGELKVSELGSVGLKDDKIKMNTK
jgi:type I restriction enzyme S subunit